jgi:hypothetical protein
LVDLQVRIIFKGEPNGILYRLQLQFVQRIGLLGERWKGRKAKKYQW